ncbi:MAG: hypothetical protein ACLPWG_17825 [Steroidobacteraceae bacterium]
MRLIPRFLVVTLTLLGCVGCDQVSKSAARALLTSGIAESFVGDALRQPSTAEVRQPRR